MFTGITHMRYSHILTGAMFLVTYLILKCVRRTNSKKINYKQLNRVFENCFCINILNISSKVKKNYLFKLIL